MKMTFKTVKKTRTNMVARLSKLISFFTNQRFETEPLGERAHRAGLTPGDLLWLRIHIEKLRPTLLKCRVKACHRKVYALGLCACHHRRLEYGTPMEQPIALFPRRPNPPKPCGIDGCGRRAHRWGLCWAHAKRKQRGKNIEAPLSTRNWRAT